ncbi:formyltransferase family protein [Hymenobacter monticola]|uniref:Ankyrin repeat domain-containing protein n=1 Tax=Hymenobacter monticola TaxID=1705399 RepID=A0ABY4AZ96_9BACT|nr:formyltransferase family protein [Hymenobacter monticola]UOE31844.1 ankyrin repeat domain-containing protein [Hymenobacter monticola]
MKPIICIAGKNDIAANVLTFVAKHYDVAQVFAVANRDDTGHSTWQQSLTATAQRLGVELIILEQAYAIPQLHFFSVEFDRIVLPQRFSSGAQLYNIHFSLLPRYKGVYTAIWPILNGETETGVTLHRMEAGIDTGPIIHQRKITLGPNDTARDVYHSCLALGHEVLCEFIPQLVAKPLAGTLQPAMGSTYYGPKSIDFANLPIDLRQTAFQVHNAVRAFTFQEYQLPSVLGRRVRASHITTTASTAKPGTILAEDAEFFSISTIDFDLQLVKDYSIELLQAIDAGDEKQVEAVLPYVPDLEVRTRQGWTPLMKAAYANHLPIAKALLAAGADVNATTKKGTSVLMYAKTAAAQSGNLALVEYLLLTGADVNAKDITGKSVLDYAELEGNPAVVALLASRITS